MADSNKYHFRIGAYSPKTMPLGRLAGYLQELVTLFGSSEKLHLVDIKEGSTQPAILIDEDYVKVVKQTAQNVMAGAASVKKMEAYRKINRMLTEDDGTANFLGPNGDNIIEFPGIKPDVLVLSGMKEAGVIEGVLQRVGGTTENIPLLLTGFDGQTISGCYTDKTRAKDLAHYLFDPIQLVGEGTWQRGEQGDWKLTAFKVDNFQKIEPTDFFEDIKALQSIDVEWPSDFAEQLDKFRETED